MSLTHNNVKNRLVYLQPSLFLLPCQLFFPIKLQQFPKVLSPNHFQCDLSMLLLPFHIPFTVLIKPLVIHIHHHTRERFLVMTQIVHFILFFYIYFIGYISICIACSIFYMCSIFFIPTQVKIFQIQNITSVSLKSFLWQGIYIQNCLCLQSKLVKVLVKVSQSCLFLLILLNNILQGKYFSS